MTVKKITIALISNDSEEFKRLIVPKYLIVLTLIFLISCGAYLGWLITDYQILKLKMPLLDKLQKENAQQRIEFAQMAKRIKQLTPRAKTIPADNHKSNGMQKLKQVKTGQTLVIHDSNQPKPILKPVEYHVGGGESLTEDGSPGRDVTPSLASVHVDAIPKKASGRADRASVGAEKVAHRSDRASVGAEKVSVVRLPIELPEERSIPAVKNTSTHEKMELYPYLLQIGSYRTLKRVDRAVLSFRRKGLYPYWVKVDLGENGVWYRVFVGHFTGKEEAKAFRQEYGLSGALIKKIAYANLIGIYSVEEQYEAEIINLEKNGYSPYIIKDDEEMFRLYVGAFFTRDGVEKQHHDLTGHGIQSEIVKR